jgi:hypothetical protein
MLLPLATVLGVTGAAASSVRRSRRDAPYRRGLLPRLPLQLSLPGRLGVVAGKLSDSVGLDKVLCTAEYSAVNEQLSHTQAAQMLDSINQSRTAMRTAIRAYCGHWYLWLWGLIWLGMALLGQLLGNRAIPFINGLCLIGLASSFLIGFIQSGQIRALLDRRFLATLGALILFGYFVWPIVLGSPHRSDAFSRLFAYCALVPMQVYVIAGIWFDNCLLWIGALISLSILLGLFFFSAIFWIWFAAFAAIPLLLSGFYIRYFMR